MNASLWRSASLWRGWMWIAAMCLLPSAAAANIAKEYRLKAAFLYNFTRFVEWPPTKFPDKASPFVIGVYGSDPFGDELKQAIENRGVNGRPITLLSVHSLSAAGEVHVVFVTGMESRRLTEIVEAFHDNGVLTVGESQAFAAAGGVITFALEGDKLRFAINLKNGERAGLKISAQLLKLASVVRR